MQTLSFPLFTIAVLLLTGVLTGVLTGGTAVAQPPGTSPPAISTGFGANPADTGWSVEATGSLISQSTTDPARDNWAVCQIENSFGPATYRWGLDSGDLVGFDADADFRLRVLICT